MQQYDEISKDMFGEHHQKLTAIKAKCDPQNSFNQLFPIEPVVSSGI